ncbi:MAG: translocation/assembly module TamB domain-containing protein [Ferruginibacter sp.]
MRVFLSIILLVIILYGVLHISSVQTWVVKKVAANLSEKLRTKVTIRKVDFRFFNKILLEGVMVEDRAKDTLLYAGTAKANINDWFFFKDKISLENVGLENAIVNMNRTDSVWNYQFLIDYFTSTKKKKPAGTDIEIDLKELHFTHIKFFKNDGWIGQNLVANLGKLDIVMDLLNIKKKKLNIRTVYMERPLFSQRDYEGRRPPKPDLQQIIQKIPVVNTFSQTNSNWEIKLGKLEIKDGSFQNDKFTAAAPYTDRFDGKHMFFSALNGTMKNLHFRNDTLTTGILLAANERSGLVIKKLQADLRITPQMMEFSNLDLVTPCSRLQDYFAMKFEDFGKDFSSFINNVTMDAHFKDAVLCSDDLAIFAPALRSWKRILYLAGNAKGTLDNFSARDMKLRSGNTVLEGNLAMRGLPDINTTFIDFESKKLRTNYTDLVSIVPQLRKLRQPAISKLGAISFTGNFTGFIRDFVAFGTFNTALGNLTADVNMKTPTGRPPAYSGNISTTGFNIGSFINNPQLGRVALNAKIVGTGFNINDLKAKVDGKADAVQFGGYNYRNIIVNGDFEKKLFIGHLSINDPNLNIPSLDGAFNLSDKNLGFQLQASVAKANLKELGFTSDNVSFAGNLDLNFTGNNIDNFLGTAKIENAVLRRDTALMTFNSLTITSEITGGKKSLTLRSNEVDANITGDFKIKELPDAVKVLLAKYYPAYIKAPSYLIKSTQDFIFSVNTKNVNQYVGLFTKKIAGFNNASATGSFNLRNNDLRLNATVPEFSYDGKVFKNLVLTGTGTGDSLVTEIAVTDIIINDSMNFPDSRLRIATSNDISLIRLNTSASRILGDAELNATVQTLDDGFKIHFFPSSFVINNKKWQLEKDGELVLRKKFLDATEVKFFHENQEIVLSTELSEVNDNTHLVARLKNIDLRDLAFILPPRPGLKGFVTGEVKAENIFGKTNIEFTGRADSFELDGRYMGRVNLEADANTTTGIINYKAGTDEKDFKFAIDGSYNYKDSSGNSLKINMLADRLNINILQPYLATIFSDMQGIATGNIAIKSANKNLSVVGDAIISGGSFKVAYTQVRYKFDQQPLRFGDGLIDLGTMQLKDTLGNPGTLSGRMYHKFFKQFSFENMRFSSPKILLLNTTKKDNIQFYGKVIGRATMTLNGDIANMKMNINGEPGEFDSSHIYLPTGISKESNVIDYIEFIRFGSLMDNTPARDAANLTVNMDFTANPACKIDVILDEETGDVIKGEGNGQLNITVGTKEPLNMRGRYELTRGEYTFNFQTFLKRPFTLSSGSITWNGDPFLAVIDMEAEYLAKNVDISSITALSNLRQQEDINILSHITGSLKKPIVSFEFKLPEKSEFNRDFYIVKRLADFKNDENEMNKQVASLLLFNQFISTDQAFITGGSTLSIATSTIGGVVSSWLTNVLSKALEKATNGIVSPYFDLNPTVNQQVTQLQANIRGGLKFRLSQNLQLLVGGNLDYNNPVTQLYSKGVITPDLSLEWLLNKDGSLRVVAFNRTTIDFTTGQRNRSGVQFGYRKDVDRLGDIFRSKRRIQQMDSIRFAPKVTPLM